MDAKNEKWGSRIGYLMACLGMCIGTGNIWRFPRVAAANGGGAFIIAWTVAMLVFAVPLLMNEMVLGKQSRLGNIGAFRDMGGEKNTWMGFFVAMTCLFIMAYYSVVNAYCFNYTWISIFDFKQNITVDQANAIWTGFLGKPFLIMGIHFISMALGFIVVYNGIQSGIEKVCKVLIPTLLAVLIFLAIRTCMLPGAEEGLEYLFHIDPKYLLSPNTWLQAFTQAAWSTGAGWGLVTVYAVYVDKKEDVPNNCLMMGMGDNLGALIAGFIVIPAIFALSPTTEAALEAAGQGNYGITFIYIYQLFSTVGGGQILSILFFFCLSAAALTSLFNMIEVGVRNLCDMGMERKPATVAVCLFGFLIGCFSAYSLSILNNQDWVWGLALLASGLMTSYIVIKYGVDKFRQEFINAEGCDFKVGKWYNVCMFIVPVAVVIMLVWWFVQSIGWYPDSWWHVLEVENFGTVVVQWAMVMILGMLLNGTFNRKIKIGPMTKKD